MARFLAGAAACFLFLTGAFLFWQSRAEDAPLLPPAPSPRSAGPSFVKLPEPPEASLKSREERRFSRADKDKNGRCSDGTSGDHDCGHGNDADGVDEDNPGKSTGTSKGGNAKGASKK